MTSPFAFLQLAASRAEPTFRRLSEQANHNAGLTPSELDELLDVLGQIRTAAMAA